MVAATCTKAGGACSQKDKLHRKTKANCSSSFDMTCHKCSCRYYMKLMQCYPNNSTWCCVNAPDWCLQNAAACWPLAFVQWGHMNFQECFSLTHTKREPQPWEVWAHDPNTALNSSALNEAEDRAVNHHLSSVSCTCNQEWVLWPYSQDVKEYDPFSPGISV